MISRPVRGSEEATRKFWLAHIWIIAVEEDVLGGLVVGDDVATELDLRLQDGAGQVLGLNGGRFEVETEGGGRVGD